MNQEIKIHSGYAEYKRAKEKGYNIIQMFGEHQHFFSSELGEISCIQLKRDWFRKKDFWEIYCLEGDLFEDTERFDTLDEAKEKCRKLLDANYKGGCVT